MPGSSASSSALSSGPANPVRSLLLAAALAAHHPSAPHLHRPERPAAFFPGANVMPSGALHGALITVPLLLFAP
jgi:hypothetical protein